MFQGTVLSPLQQLNDLGLVTMVWGSWKVLLSPFHRWGNWFREVEWPAQGHSADKWLNWDSNLENSGSWVCLPDHQVLFSFPFSKTHIVLFFKATHNCSVFKIWPFHSSHTHTKLDLHVHCDLDVTDCPKSGSWQHCVNPHPWLRYSCVLSTAD